MGLVTSGVFKNRTEQSWNKSLNRTTQNQKDKMSVKTENLDLFDPVSVLVNSEGFLQIKAIDVS